MKIKADKKCETENSVWHLLSAQYMLVIYMDLLPCVELTSIIHIQSPVVATNKCHYILNAFKKSILVFKLSYILGDNIREGPGLMCLFFLIHVKIKTDPPQ